MWHKQSDGEPEASQPLSFSAPPVIYRLPLTGTEEGGGGQCPVPKKTRKKNPPAPLLSFFLPHRQTLEACSTSSHLVDFAAALCVSAASVCFGGGNLHLDPR